MRILAIASLLILSSCRNSTPTKGTDSWRADTSIETETECQELDTQFKEDNPNYPRPYKYEWVNGVCWVNTTVYG